MISEKFVNKLMSGFNVFIEIFEINSSFNIIKKHELKL
jgi:hypothetical protein